PHTSVIVPGIEHPFREADGRKLIVPDAPIQREVRSGSPLISGINSPRRELLGEFAVVKRDTGWKPQQRRSQRSSGAADELRIPGLRIGETHVMTSSHVGEAGSQQLES